MAPYCAIYWPPFGRDILPPPFDEFALLLGFLKFLTRS